MCGNSVNIKGGIFFGYSDIYGGRSSSGTATGNSMTIEGGTFDDVNIYAGYSAGGTATGNSVTIEDGTFNSGSV
ncbi:MAG: hypothetical protein MJ048_04700, partial [Acidaminococcaceae bacterium]|nr:hypothetical protein [Acidaminococcaceae bacterium]